MADSSGLEEAVKPVDLGDGVVSFDGCNRFLDSAGDAEDVVDAILLTNPCESLILRGNSFGIGAAKAIGAALARCHQLKRAIFCDMFTRRSTDELPQALAYLVDGILKAGARLEHLDLSDNAFGPIGSNVLVPLLASRACFDLKTLELNNNGLGPSGAKIIADALLRCAQLARDEECRDVCLKTLVMGRNRLEDDGAIAMASVLNKYGTLREIAMPQNGIRGEGITALSKAIECNTNLRIINFSDNAFSGNSGFRFALALKKLRNVEELNLDDCLLHDNAAEAVSLALREHKNLKRLRLCGNELTTESALEILRCICGLPGIQLVDLNYNCLGDRGIRKLKQKAKDCKLDCFGSFSGDEGVEYCSSDEYEEKECTEPVEDHGGDLDLRNYLEKLYYGPWEADLLHLMNDDTYKSALDLLATAKFPRRLARTVVTVSSVSAKSKNEKLQLKCVQFCEDLISIALNKKELSNEFLCCLANEMRITAYHGLYPDDDVSGSYTLLRTMLDHRFVSRSMASFFQVALKSGKDFINGKNNSLLRAVNEYLHKL